MHAAAELSLKLSTTAVSKFPSSSQKYTPYKALPYLAHVDGVGKRLPDQATWRETAREERSRRGYPISAPGPNTASTQGTSQTPRRTGLRIAHAVQHVQSCRASLVRLLHSGTGNGADEEVVGPNDSREKYSLLGKNPVTFCSVDPDVAVSYLSFTLL